MNVTLAKKLNSKGLLLSTEVGLRLKNPSLDGTVLVKSREVYTVLNVSETDDNMIFEVCSTVDGKKKVVECKNIETIDGMHPERFALVYDIKCNGQDIVPGKRRGRKPKIRTLEAPRVTEFLRYAA